MNPTPLRRRAAPLGAAVAAFAAAALLLAIPSLLAPAGGEEAPEWSDAAVRARFPSPDLAAKPETYVGTAECKECHEDRWKSLGTSFHAELRNEKKSGSRGCESCHGPAQAHVDDGGDGPIRDPSDAKPADVIGSCVVCHADVLTDPIEGHRLWISGPKGALRSCTTCHSIHVDAKSPAHDDTLGPFATKKALAEAAKGRDAPPAAVCAKCHTSFHPEMTRSGHADLLAGGEGCAACHGNGALHAESGGERRKILQAHRLPAKDADALCMACHDKGDAVVRWTCAEHAREGVTCVTCHDANAPKGRTLRGSEFELCGGCHKDVQAKMRLPSRHRAEDGRVTCSDCHDPHGNTSRLRDAALRRDVCGECHTEKTQPFLHDHGIKRGEGCVACHDPHGSANRRMLTFATTKPLCLQCHPETPHDLSRPRYDNCVSCHTEIHGSDLDRVMRR